MNKIFKDSDHIVNHGEELILIVTDMHSKISVMTKIDPLGDKYYPTAIASAEDFSLLTKIGSNGVYSMSLNGVHDFYFDTKRPCTIYGKIIKHEKDKPQVLNSFKYINTGGGIYTGAVAGLAIAGLAIVGTE